MTWLRAKSSGPGLPPQAEAESCLSSHVDQGESGQAAILLLLMLGTFLFAVLAFSVDLSGMWFHRQAVQSAADAACLAGAEDMLALDVGVTPPSAGFTPGTGSNCVASAGASICKYAGFNGYPGAGLSATSESNSVAWTFPATVSGATAPVTTPATTNPFLQVALVENVKTYFAGLFGKRYQQVAATATCGMTEVKTAPPILVLDTATTGHPLYMNGTPSVTIVGGPSRSVQVNSSSTNAIDGVGSKGGIDTRQAGPNGTGGDIALWGAEASPPTNGYTLGTGSWVPSALPFPDPFSNVPAPTGTTAGVVKTKVPSGTDGCPVAIGSTCTEYGPGVYASGITVHNDTAIFAPGIFILDGDFSMDSNSIVRNAYPGQSAAVQTLDGVMFYMRHGAVSIGANAGASVTTVASSLLTCNGTVPAGIPTTPLTGSILNAQCVDDGTYVGSTPGVALSAAGYRGMLFFEGHANASSPAYTSSGGGSLLLSGTEYFHSSTKGIMSFQGTPSSSTYMLGYIVTDDMTLGGNGGITMVLSSLPTVTTLKIALLQ